MPWDQPAGAGSPYPAEPGPGIGQGQTFQQPLLLNRSVPPPPAISFRSTPSPTFRLLVTLALLAAAGTLVYLFLLP